MKYSIFVFLFAVFSQIIIAQVKDFEGLSYSGETPPPDPVIAVSSDYVVQVVNKRIAVFNKNGTSLFEQSFSDFFSNQSPPDKIFDPKLAYDQFSNRFILLAAGKNNDGTNSNYMLAVTQSSNPSTSNNWYKYKLNAVDQGLSQYEIDFPGLGYDEEAIYLTTNEIYGEGGSSYYPKVTILNKSEVYSGTISYRKDFKDFSSDKSLKPMRKFGTSNGYYLMNTTDQNNAKIWKIENPLTSNASLTAVTTINLGSYSSISEASQKGITNKVDMGDYRISDVVCLNGILYGAYTVQNTTQNGSMIVYFKVNTSNNFELNAGTIESPDVYFYYPVLQPDYSGNIVFVFNKSSNNDYIGIAWTILFNGNSQVETISWLKQGIASYYYPINGKNRWGDYSGIGLDPKNNFRVWICGEWADLNNQWSTWIGEISTGQTIDITFTNTIYDEGTGVLNENAGGTLSVNSSQVNSGESIPLETGNSYNERTNNERFSNWNNYGYTYKHNQWNNEPNKKFLSSDFEATVSNNDQKAFYKSLNYAKVEVRLEGEQITGKGEGYFQDPWYVLSDGSQPGNYWKDFNSYYEPIGKEGASEKGVFLNQGADWTPPYYSVQALSSQQDTLPGIGIRDFYFFSWDYDENKISLQNPLYATTGVVFKQADATLTANLKGHLLSNNQNALSGGSQRRLVRTENGIYHLVYESMGVIWYTHSNSTNFNGSWSAEAGVEIGKNPSMDFNYNTVRIVCEKSDADSSIIEMITIDPDYNNPPDYEYEDVIHFPLSYYGNAKPVISTGSVLTYIAYRKNVTDGIHQVCRFYQGIWNDQIISGTNADCMNPSIAGAGEDIHLVCANNSRIEYIFCYKKNAWEYHSPEYISDGSGNNANGNPCITLANGYPVVSWIGSYSSSGINKSTGEVGRDIPPMVVARRRGSSWGSFFKSGSDVVSVNSNSSNNSTEQTVIAWSEGTTQNYTSNWVRRVDTAYSDPHNLSSNGVQTQVSNGTDLTDMGGVLLSTATTPYDLPLLTTDFNQLFPGGPGGTGKIKSHINLGYGREGIISKNGVEFLFDIGDVIAGDSVIKFIYRPDTLSYASAEELNEVVRTENFPLNPSAEFYFTDFYYVLNPGAADTLLSGDDLVNFKAELVDAGSGSIVGTFDNVTYTKEQLTEHNNVSYRVDCSNITPGSYYLRLVTTVQGDAEYSLADVQNNADELAKHSYNEIVYDGTKLPETYDLSQNFPNPFNPATTINYQMPENGFVTLKIYDILGKEVATLVNEQKTQGRYSVNFDASRLASGVYIYQIRVNDYVSSKKMLLLK